MLKRGKVLRDTSAGTGLIVADNQQYSFTLDGVWKSEVLPAAGMTVDVELDAAGQVTSIRAVTDSQVSKEQAQAALEAAKSKGAAVASGVVAKVGAANLIAIALLLIGWFFLSAVTIQSPLGGNMSFTFWQLLGFVNSKSAVDLMMQAGSGKASTGMYGLLAWVCLAGPFVRFFWKDKRAVLGGVLPLLFMIIVGLVARSSFNSALGLGANSGVDPNNPLVQQMQQEVKQAVSIGFGIYLSALACLYFAGISVKEFLAANAKAPTQAASQQVPIR